MSRPALLLFLGLALAGCYRVDERVTVLHIPEAHDEDLQALSDFLLADNRFLRDDPKMILDITPLPDLPGLEVRYNPLTTATRNLEHRVASAGFTANDIPGNPETRSAFRAGQIQPR